MLYLMKNNTYAAFQDLKYILFLYCFNDTLSYIINQIINVTEYKCIVNDYSGKKTFFGVFYLLNAH